MGVMYGTKVYDISIDHCLYWGMSYCMQLRFAIWWSWVYRYITAPQLRMVLLLEFLNFSMYVVPYDWTA